MHPYNAPFELGGIQTETEQQERTGLSPTPPVLDLECKLQIEERMEPGRFQDFLQTGDFPDLTRRSPSTYLKVSILRPKTMTLDKNDSMNRSG